MGVIDILSELVRINSVNPEWGGPGERDVATWVRRFFEERNIDVWENEVLPGRPNVIARMPGQNPNRRVVLEAHMDTVATGGMTVEPFDPVIRDGKLFGRGSVDVKCGLAAMMDAVSRIKNPPCEVWLAAVIDEENAYRGVLNLIDELPEAHAAIVAEPTENLIVRANKGVLRWRITTHGKAAHSAKPHLGKSAIHEMAAVLSLIEKDNERLAEKCHPLVGPATCCVGTIEGGTQVNIVPDRCQISLDRRMLPGETGEAVLAEYRELFTGLDASMESPDLVDEGMETAESEAVVQVSKSTIEELGGNPETVGVPFGCDATKLSRAGIPSIIFGPGSINQAHGAIEFVEIEQVEFAAEFYRKVVMDFR